MRFIRCGIHGFHETIGIDADEFRVYWALESDIENDKQTSYQVVVSTDIEPYHPTSTVVFDSGQVPADSQRNIRVVPKDGFQSTTNYYWQVRVYNVNDESTVSGVNHFFTAYPRSRSLPPYSMNQTYMPHTSLIFRTWFENEHDRWKAVWIGSGTDKPLYLRKSFQLQRKPVKAIALASGLGHFNLSCNGQPASSHVLDPGWTNYYRTVQYVGYDLTDRMEEGENVLGAHVGNGFYAGDQGNRFFWPLYEDKTYIRHGNELCFFAELHLFYDNGDHETLITDPSWKVRQSATTLANVYASETQDRRLYPSGWMATNYDDNSWVTATPLTGPRGLLRYQSQPPIVLHEIFTPKSTKVPRDGVVCFDLGQNSSIMVKIAVQGDAGSKVIVRYSESVNDDGTVLMPDPLFKEFETHVYSEIYLAGTGEPEIWQPDFCFTSARYLQIEGVALEQGQDLPVILSAVGQHVSSAARKLGTVRTDKDDVNQLINACYWSFVSNLFSYHTDCPQIEKFGWQEVTHLLAPATQYIRDMESMYTKILDDIIDTQEPSGLCPTMAPEFRRMCGPLFDTITWGCSVCLLPMILKQYYGSTNVLEKVYPAATRYMDYMRSKERKGGLIEHGLGDWGYGIAFGNHQANIETAYFYACLRAMQSMAEDLAIPTDIQKYKTWAERIYKAYNDNLLILDDPSPPPSIASIATSTPAHKGAYYTSLDDPQTHDLTAISQAIALQFNLVPTAQIPAIKSAFLNAVDDHTLRSGEIGLKPLFNTLRDLNRPDIVLAMARQPSHPSYMRFLRRGETTLCEFWQDECRSKCHDMLGTVYEWIYDSVLGIRSIEDGYRRFEVWPAYENEFGWVAGSVDCPYGVVAVEFRREERGYRLEVTVPFGTDCGVRLIDRVETEYGVVGSEKRQTTRDAMVRLGHGRYSFWIKCGDGS